jgi:hypothetical protein
MRKNITLILILIIATFSNFTIAKTPLKWRRDELFDGLQDVKSYIMISSNHSSLVERQANCQPAISSCSGTEGCCGPVCDSIRCCPPGTQCCGIGCCDNNGDIITCNGDSGGCEEDLITDNADNDDDIACEEDDTEDSEEDKIPLSSCKTKKIKESSEYCRKQADKAPYAYIYDSNSGILTQRTLDSTINRAEVQADHVLEAQIITKYLKEDEDGRKIAPYITLGSSYYNELKEILNDETNIRYVTGEVNRAKAQYFSGNNVNSTVLNGGVKVYLNNTDTYYAFKNTHDNVIKLFNKVVIENKLDVPNFDKIKNSLGRTEYENLTKRLLVTNDSSNNSSSTLPLLHLPVILSVILSLVFLVFGECGQKITRVSISHISHITKK